MRLVFDTNVLIDGFQDDFSAQARLVEAARQGDITAIITIPIEREYRLILSRLIADDEYRDQINDFMSMAEVVTPGQATLAIDDPEDIKFLEAAAGGQADWLVTMDRHLLDAGEVGQTAIITPQEAWNRFEDDSDSPSSAWNDFVKGLGIGGK